MASSVLSAAFALIGCLVACSAEEFSSEVFPDGSVRVSAGATMKAEPDSILPYELEHSFGLNEPFVPRGSLEVESLGLRRSVRLSSDLTLTSPADRAMFAALVETEGFYRIRVRSSAGTPHEAPPSPDSGEDDWVVASIRVCDLVTSGFKEELKVLLDAPALSAAASMAPRILSIDYRVPASHFARKRSCHAPGSLPATVTFSSAATVVEATPAQALAVQPTDGAAASGQAPWGVPPALVAKVANAGNGGAGPGGAGGAGGANDPANNQSFLRRYWYVILPIMILMLSGAPPEEGQAPAAGGGGGGGGPAR